MDEPKIMRSPVAQANVTSIFEPHPPPAWANCASVHVPITDREVMPSKWDSTEHFANVAEEIHDIVATTVDDPPEITPLLRSTQANVVRQSDDENPDDSAELEHTNPPTMRTDPYDHPSAKEGWTIFCVTANCDPNANKVFLEEDFDDVEYTYPIARRWRYVRSQVAGRFDVLLWVPPDFLQDTPHVYEPFCTIYEVAWIPRPGLLVR
jgi:hypothetical protein